MKPPDNFEQTLWKSLNQGWKIPGIFLNNFRVFSKIIPDQKKNKKKKKSDGNFQQVPTPWSFLGPLLRGSIGYSLPCVAQRSWTSSSLYICLWTDIKSIEDELLIEADHLHVHTTFISGRSSKLNKLIILVWTHLYRIVDSLKCLFVHKHLEAEFSLSSIKHKYLIHRYFLQHFLYSSPTVAYFYISLLVPYDYSKFFYRLEINTLRTEQCSTCTNGNRLKNEQLTVQWLANSITEIRGEMKELVRSFNTTAELQEQQTLTTDISILQNDIVSLRHDVESFKGDIAKSTAKMATLTQDVEVSRQLSQSTAAIAANLTEKVTWFTNFLLPF